jgi:exodeoxyribonuclease-5
VLHPGAIRPDATESPRCFNFSLGRPLAGEPLVRCALELLQLGGGKGAKVEQARLSALLLADGWATASEADGRALLDAALRRDLPWLTTLTALLRLAKRLADDAPCRRSIAALTALADTLGGAPRRLRPGQWLGVFRTALAAAGWPGERPLSSREFQARRAFDDVLAAFARLEPLLGSLSQSEAVRRLGQLCRQRIFQPETRGQPALQILGLLESAGLEFDALWVMGMNDDQWPPRPRPNPLLPIESQRAAGSAHASAEVELDFARRIHARLLDAAPEVVFSYARAEGNRLLRPSPLLAGLPERTLATPQPSTIATRLAAASGQLEQLDDAAAPPLLAGETVSGGSWLLRAQAICPAWAFYQYRLGAEALAEPLEGLDPADRGSLAHGALEAFWRQTQDSAKLAALDETALAEAIAAAVAEAIRRFEAARQTQLPARFRQLEAARLEKLLSVWLGFEAGRPAPFTVVACEQRAEIEIEGIRIRLVVDRIDQLADGRQIIIDYKTGAAIDSKNWSSPRLTEPQLPIYAALVNDQVAAVVFARALPDQPAFTGVADEKDILPGVPGLGDARQKIFDPAKFSDWPAVITHWRACLHTVAGEIRDGWAGVVFADAKDLQYCPALPLLRLPERQRLLAVAVSGQRV